MTPFAILPLLLSSTEQIEKIEVRAARDLLNSDNFNHAQAIFMSSEHVTSANNTVADWLTNMPSFSLNGQGGLYQSYSIRGLSRWRIRTNVNGIPIMTDRRAGNSASFIDPALVKNVSLLAGPSSLLYGSGAIAGVVSIESETYQPPTFSSTATDSDQSYSLLAANGNDKTSFAISHRAANEGKDANGETIYSAYEQSSIGLNYKTQLNQQYEFKVRWLGSLSNDVQKSSSDDFSKKASIYPNDIHSLADISLTGLTWHLNIFNHYQNWDSKVTRNEKRENLTSYQSHTLGSSFYKESMLASIPTRFGFDWVSRSGVKITDKETDFRNDEISNNTLIDGHYHNLGTYIQSKFSIQGIELNLGTRYDLIETKNLTHSKEEQHISGNLSARYSFNNQHTTTFTVGSAFRFPTLTELYFNGVTPRGNTLGNKNLKTEQSLSYELTHKIKINNYTLQGSYFRTNLSDYIERVRINDNTRTYINLDEARISGFELSASLVVNKMLNHSLTYSTQNGEDQSGNHLSDISPSKLSLVSKINFGNYDVVTDIFYRSEHSEFGSGEAPLPSLISANIKANWFINEELTGTIGVTNLFNKLYKKTADEDAPYANERRIKIGIKWQRI